MRHGVHRLGTEHILASESQHRRPNDVEGGTDNAIDGDDRRRIPPRSVEEPPAVVLLRAKTVLRRLVQPPHEVKVFTTQLAELELAHQRSFSRAMRAKLRFAKGSRSSALK